MVSRFGRSTITRDVRRMVPHIAAQRNPGDVFAVHQILPSLRGFWPMNVRDNGEDVFDVSGHGQTLTNVSATSFNAIGPISFAEGDGGADYLTIADNANLSITNHITLGCWAYSNNTPGGTESLIAKWLPAGNQRSYALNILSTPAWEFVVDQTGAGTTINTITSTDYTAAKWHHVVGRLSANNEYSIFVNGTETVSTSSPVTGIFNSTAAFRILARDGPAQYLDGDVALAWVCAAVVSDAMIQMVFEKTRGFFGV